jgi:hypothetical protein
MTIYVKSFLYGFLYVFGFSRYPYPNDLPNFTDREDVSAIANDWKNVGIEVMKAYESSEKPTTAN